MTSTPAEPKRRGPLDPRLVRHVRAARAQVLAQTGLGIAQAVCVIATAICAGGLGARMLADHQSPLSAPLLLGGLVGSLLLRALFTWGQQRIAHRAATATVADLRGRLVAHASALGPRAGAGRGADLTAVATTGIEALRPYMVGYVPELLLAATVTPLTLIAIGILDPASAVLALITIPLIPIFMILVGKMTEGRSEQLLVDMRRLWSQLLDLVEGLPTLRALGRERGPEKTVEHLAEQHRRSTMGSLRYAFLSSMVLELLATLGVALVAVGIGLRLVSGSMELAPGIAALVLAPEVFWPLRRVGQQFHASTDGLAALDAVFGVLDEKALPEGTAPAPDLAHGSLVLEGASVRGRDGWAPHDASFAIRPGRVLAVTGPSGSGKTTAMWCALGMLRPGEGKAFAVAADGTRTPVLDLERDSLWSQITLLPQRPVLSPGTIREILRSARPTATDAELDEAARASGLAPVVAEHGWDAPLGRDGAGLSLGEAQRLSLARAVLSPAPVIVFDEPTAHLDGASERIVMDLVAALRDQGRAIAIIAHRDALVALADDVVELAPAPDPQSGAPEAALEPAAAGSAAGPAATRTHDRDAQEGETR